MLKSASIELYHHSPYHGNKIRQQTSVRVRRVNRTSAKHIHSALQSTDVKKQRIKNNCTVQTFNPPASAHQSMDKTIDQKQLLEQDKEIILHPRTLTPTDYHDIRLSETSKSNVSFDSISHITRFSNYSSKILLRSPQIYEKDWKQQKRHRRRRRRCCGLYFTCCSPCCCCIGSILALLLLLIGLTALLVALLTNKGSLIKTTSTTTTSTSSTSTSSSSTSASSSTSSTSTSSSSTSSTTSTSSISTSSSSTSTSTSTSTTSETTVSTTTETTTSSTSTTSTTTSSTTPSPPCPPLSVGSSSTLHNAITGPTIYTCQAFQWTAPSTGPVALAFEMRNDPSSWYIDDVSVYHGGTQMLLNGGFETGAFAPGWQRTQATGSTCGIYPGQISTVMPRTGTYSIRDGSLTCKDKIGQSFIATAGDVYIVSYWYKTNALGSGQSITVTLS